MEIPRELSDCPIMVIEVVGHFQQAFVTFDQFGIGCGIVARLKNRRLARLRLKVSSRHVDRPEVGEISIEDESELVNAFSIALSIWIASVCGFVRPKFGAVGELLCKIDQPLVGFCRRDKRIAWRGPANRGTGAVENSRAVANCFGRLFQIADEPISLRLQ